MHVLTIEIVTEYGMKTSVYDIWSKESIMIISFNYGKGALFKCEVEFEDKLDLKGLVCEESHKKYALFGVICHRGSADGSGHYVAYCKHFDGKWYLFNDKIVTQSYSGAWNIKHPENHLDEDMPYVVFYQKIN